MDRIKLLRVTAALLLFAILPSGLAAEELSDSASNSTIVDFDLSGSTTEAVAGFAPPTKVAPSYQEPVASLTILRMPNSIDQESRSFSFGNITLFARETSAYRQQGVRLGTSLAHGRATTGFSLTYHGEKSLGEPEMFVDFLVTDAVHFGLSGRLTEHSTSQGEQVGRFGLNAAYDFGGAAVIQGEISDTFYSAPEFGIAFGLKF